MSETGAAVDAGPAGSATQVLPALEVAPGSALVDRAGRGVPGTVDWYDKHSPVTVGTSHQVRLEAAALRVQAALRDDCEELLGRGASSLPELLHRLQAPCLEWVWS